MIPTVIQFDCTAVRSIWAADGQVVLDGVVGNFLVSDPKLNPHWSPPTFGARLRPQWVTRAVHGVLSNECEFARRLDTFGALGKGVLANDVVLGAEHVEDCPHLKDAL